MIHGIVFDCFGVLTETAWDQLIGDLSAEERRAVIDARKVFDRGMTDFDAFRQAVRQAAPSVPSGLLRDTFVARTGFRKNKTLLQLIAELHKTYKIGVLSNAGTNWLTEELLTPAEAALFDCILLSHTVGLVKPEPEFFLLACQKLALPPTEVLMVDDRQYNIDAARSVGMQGILYTNSTQFKHELSGILADSNH